MFEQQNLEKEIIEDVSTLNADADLINVFEYGNTVVANVQDDKRERFPDGAQIRTSTVRKLIYDTNDNLVGIQTRNTLYRVLDNIVTPNSDINSIL